MKYSDIFFLFFSENYPPSLQGLPSPTAPTAPTPPPPPPNPTPTLHDALPISNIV